MPNLVPYGLGRHITALTVTMQTVNEMTGALGNSAVVANLVTSTGTIGTNLVHTAQLTDDVEWSIRNNLETIQSITRNRAHNVPTTIGGRFTIREIVRLGSGEASLATCWFTGPSRIALIKFYFAGAGYDIYARMRALRIRCSRTKNVDTAEFVMIDVGNVANAPVLTTGMR